MRKVCYEWNPGRMLSNPTYFNMNLGERAVYRELIDLMWLTKDQYRIEFDLMLISNLSGISTGKIKQVIEKGLSGDKPLFMEELCLSNLKNYLQSHDLLIQLIEYEKQKEADSKTSIPQQTNTLKNRIINKEKGKVSEHRVLGVYDGWMPTNRFDSIGQIYKVRKNLIDKLHSMTSEINIYDELINIYEWLKRNPEGRKAVSEMELFITKWIRRSINKRNDISEISELDFESCLDNLFEKSLN